MEQAYDVVVQGVRVYYDAELRKAVEETGLYSVGMMCLCVHTARGRGLLDVGMYALKKHADLEHVGKGRYAAVVTEVEEREHCDAPVGDTIVAAHSCMVHLLTLVASTLHCLYL